MQKAAKPQIVHTIYHNYGIFWQPTTINTMNDLEELSPPLEFKAKKLVF